MRQLSLRHLLSSFRRTLDLWPSRVRALWAGRFAKTLVLSAVACLLGGDLTDLALRHSTTPGMVTTQICGKSGATHLIQRTMRHAS